MDPRQTLRSVEKIWDESIIPALTEYIRIPCKSPAFDPDWRQHGHLDRAAALVEGWCRERSIEGMEIEVVRLEGRTPLVFMEIPGEIEDTVMLYGHIDKQPEMSGWSEGLGPWEPVLRDDKLYGRGGADDGYAAFAALAAIEALREQGTPHARCVVLIEACEESGSTDLPHHIEELAHRIGQPSRSSPSTRAPATSISSGAPPPCGGSSPAISPSRCSPRACTRGTPRASCPPASGS